MAQTEIVQDEQRLKQRAMRRLAIALVLIAGAIAGLAILDRYNAALKKPQVAPSPPEPRVLATPPPTPTLPPSEKPPPPPRATGDAPKAAVCCPCCPCVPPPRGSTGLSLLGDGNQRGDAGRAINPLGVPEQENHSASVPRGQGVG